MRGWKGLFLRAKAIRSYEDLEVYQRAMALVPQVHQLALKLPDWEKYRLAYQLRQTSEAIPDHIAEGYRKKTSANEFAGEQGVEPKVYLVTALQRSNDMLVLVTIASDRYYGARQTCQELFAAYTVVGEQLHRLIQRWH